MIIYQVLPRIWGKGKFADWDKKAFDYLKSLGVNAIWYTGVIRHASGKPFVKGDPGSPYSIEDYRDVNPYLAVDPDNRMQEFSMLVARTHEAGLKVIIDLVPNHVSPDCQDVPVYDRYDYDWSDTRKIDYSKKEAWDAMLDIALYWADLEVDGMRCDMVEMVPQEFMGWLISEVRRKYPDFLFIGEVYNKDNYRAYIQNVGFDLLYDKSGLYDILRAVICNGASARNITRNWQSLQDLQPHMLNFLENHDEQRFASRWFAGDASKAFPALAVGALFNGASYMIYAGQEVGEAAPEGVEGRTSIFNWTKSKSLSILYEYLHACKQLESDNLKLLCGYRKLFSLLSDPVFSEGFNYDLCWCNSILTGFDPEKHFAFLRYKSLPLKHKAEAVLVVCNFSDYPTDMKINLPEDLRAKKELAWLPAKVDVSVSAWGYSPVHL